MKTIIYNDSNLKDSEMTKTVRRAKMIIMNSSDEMLLIQTDEDFHFLGGHVDVGESDSDTLVREIKEECGVVIEKEDWKPFISIKYYTDNYPPNNDKTLFINNYYYIYSDVEINLQNASLTKSEKANNFKPVFISKYEILQILFKKLNSTIKPNVIYDTIDVIIEYLKKEGN